MIRVVFVEHDGNEHAVEAEDGASLMQAAMNNLVPGIDADCGGECSCATCHVIVTDEWFDKVGGASEAESAMLQLTPERTSTSRLACQIRISGRLDGLVVRLPEFQM